MKARAIMVLGTSSHVGKSLLTAALCRIFARAGYRVAPFKSQNMSLNSAATPEGLEIGRAQALQAEAAGVPASVHMNPILLKPCGERTSQVVVRGRIWGQLSASDYHLRRVQELLPLVQESYEVLAATHDVIVLEGAGSPAEINLKQHDIVNMRIAELADAACVLVGDIDRGGVFAALLGTILLLEPQEQARIRGFAINKFRGDRALLEPGIAMMEERLGKPCVGVVPWLPGLLLEEEDSVGLPGADGSQGAWPGSDEASRPLRIAVVALPSFSNFTDFDALRSEPAVALRFVREVNALALADVVILPGSKQTVADLQWLRDVGLAAAIEEHARRGLTIGICGGYQMLGEHIADPHGVEACGDARGLGLLPVRTEMQQTKITRLTSARTCAPMLFGQALGALPLAGYEIHVGSTPIPADAQPFAVFNPEDNGGQVKDGCVSADGRIVGAYLHGLFDEDAFRHAFIQAARAFYGLTPASTLEAWQARRAASLDRLADEVFAAMNMAELFSWVGLPAPGEAGGGR